MTFLREIEHVLPGVESCWAAWTVAQMIWAELAMISSTLLLMPDSGCVASLALI
jgi:hypothetical protein